MTRTATHYLQFGDEFVLTASEREYHALRLAAAGLNLDDLAHALNIHRSTAYTYITHWAQQTGAHNRTMLAAWAIVTGFITPGDVWSIWATHAPQLAAWQRAEAHP